jgi:hypothetical protein
VIPRKAIQAIHAAICEESLEDHMDPAWPGRCVKAAQAAHPHIAASVLNDAAESLIKQQFDEVTPRMLQNRARSYKPRNAD